MEKFKEGQKVKYKGEETRIKVIHDDGTCNIANPNWDWDEELLCVNNGIYYDVPFCITVKVSELSA